MKILLIDDHALVREALRAVLKRLKPEACIFETPYSSRNDKGSAMRNRGSARSFLKSSTPPPGMAIPQCPGIPTSIMHAECFHKSSNRPGVAGFRSCRCARSVLKTTTKGE